MLPVRWRRPTRRSVLVAAALALVLGYGALLRLHALFDSYGPYTKPGWLAAIQPAVQHLHAAIGPGWPWPHYDQPYVGSDPFNYLKFAREMERFYQPHVREPVFLVAVKTALWLSGGADVGISLASIAFSLLLAVATFLLGREMLSTAAGLAAAALMAIDHDVVAVSIEGWRDSAFGAIALTAVWLWLRTRRSQSRRTAIAAGLATGFACLTRLTAPFMIVPAALSLVAVRDRVARRRGAQLVGLGGLVAGVLVAPYLIACAMKFGDPLYAINYHTQFYLEREGTPPEVISAGTYVAGKFRTTPIETTDHALEGLVVYPFQNKWHGMNWWRQGLGTVLSWLSVAGLVAWLWVPDGRVLLAALVGSLVPYMVTWTIRGGSEWRFTEHAYPIYFLASVWTLQMLVTLVRTRGRDLVDQPARLVRRLAVTAGLFALATLWWRLAPYYIVRESLLLGRPTPVIAGARDAAFFKTGWSTESVTGSVHARFGLEPWSRLIVPLPEKRPYALVLRMDPLPFDDLPPQRVRVMLNGKAIGQFQLAWDPNLVGRYPLEVPADLVRPGANELTLHPEYTVPAAQVADRYPSIATAGRVGFRFWNILIQPR